MNVFIALPVVLTMHVSNWSCNIHSTLGTQTPMHSVRRAKKLGNAYLNGPATAQVHWFNVMQCNVIGEIKLKVFFVSFVPRDW